MKTSVTLGFLYLASTIQGSGATTVFEAKVAIYCEDATCRIPAGCDDSIDLPSGAVKSEDDPELFSNINGNFVLKEPCVMECDGCGALVGSREIDDPNDTCIGNAGFVYCPETNECIRPFDTSCPIAGTLTFDLVGPGTLKCKDDARCIDLTDGCEISFGAFGVGGKYIPGLLGDYALPENCEIICSNCICEGCSNDFNANPTTPTPDTTTPTGGDSSSPAMFLLTSLWLSFPLFAIAL